MKVIIAGSRTITKIEAVVKAVTLSNYTITEVISGTCHGVDQLGETWARQHNIPIKRFPADWRTHGKGAGFIRNEEMALYADALIAVWDGKSHGTKHMIKCMANKPTVVYTPIAEEELKDYEAAIQAQQAAYGVKPDRWLCIGCIGKESLYLPIWAQFNVYQRCSMCKSPLPAVNAALFPRN